MEGIEYHNGKRIRKPSQHYGSEYAMTNANIKKAKENAAALARQKAAEQAAKKAEKETSELTKMFGSFGFKGGRRRKTYKKRKSTRRLRKRKTMRRR